MSGPGQHRGLSAERWSAFSFDQQILAIGNEMNRTLAMLEQGEWGRARLGHQRVLQLTDLTAGLASTRGRRRELLRRRDLMAALYLQPSADAAEHRHVFRALLQFTPAAAQQIEPLLGRFPREGAPGD